MWGESRKVSHGASPDMGKHLTRPGGDFPVTDVVSDSSAVERFQDRSGTPEGALISIMQTDAVAHQSSVGRKPSRSRRCLVQ